MRRKNRRANQRLFQSALLLVCLWLVGCASDLNDQHVIDEITAELQNQDDPIAILEKSELTTTIDSDLYSDDSEATKELPTFSMEEGTAQFVNPNAKRPIRDSNDNEAVVTLNFENANLREVIKFIMTDLLELNYIISPQVQGVVTLQTSRPVTKEDLLPTLETILKINGAAIVDDGDIIHILPQQQALSKTSPNVGKISSLKPGYQVRIIPLRYLSAEEAQQNLAPFLPEGSLISIDPIKNILTVAGSSSELANIQKTIDTFDVDWLKGMSIGVYRFKNVTAEEVMPELESLFGPGGDSPFAGLFRFIPMERVNSVMVITTQKSYLTEANNWLERIDRNESTEVEAIYVYRVKNGRAEDLAYVLGSVFGSGTTSPARPSSVAPGETSTTAQSRNTASVNQSSVSKSNTTNTRTLSRSFSSRNSGDSSSAPDVQASIIADEVNNSLVIRATRSNYDKVLQALRQLDVPKLQVMLDVVIAEITLSDSLNYGFRYFLENNPEGDGYNPNGSSNSLEIGSIPQVAGGFNYSLTNIAGRINAAVNMLAEKGLAQFLSTPSLMVLDNETATMSVGEQISIEGESFTNNSDVVTSSNEYLDTGIDLEITPRVNSSGMVVLDISQSVSRQTGGVGSSGNPNIYERSIVSSIAARDGQTIVLGGLIQEQNSSDRGGVPYLQDIPIMGSLFRNTEKTVNRTELVVLVTPRVVRNSEESLQVTKDFRAKLKGLDIYNKTKNTSGE